MGRSGLSHTPIAQALPSAPVSLSAGPAHAAVDDGWQAAATEALAMPLARLDAQGCIRALNGAWRGFVCTSGIASADVVGADFVAALRRLGEDGSHSATDAVRGIETVQMRKSAAFEMDFACQAGKQARWYWMRVTPLADGPGCVIAFLDITDRKIVERSQAQLAAVLESTTDYVATVDEHGNLLYANRALRQMRGLPLDPGAGLGSLRGIYAEAAYADIALDALPAAAARGDWAGETSLVDHIGRAVPVHQVILAHRGEAGEIGYFSTIMRDMTASQQQAASLRKAFQELQQTQEQLVHSEKMASLGQLTAGIAHEINNPVGYLQSNLTTLGQYVGDLLKMVASYESATSALVDPEVRAAVERTREATDFAFLLEDLPKLVSESREGTQRVRKIVQDLKDFAHAGANEAWQWVDLRHNLERTLNIVHNELKYKAEVEQVYGDLPEVRCLPGQLNQVFMNLLVNAGQAIEEAGRIRISAHARGDTVQIEVSDTGSGMPPEVRARVFEPFYTTKAVGKGTGLGLSISYGIVQKHGGTIEVDSEAGQGTTFRITLPVTGPATADQPCA